MRRLWFLSSSAAPVTSAVRARAGVPGLDTLIDVWPSGWPPGSPSGQSGCSAVELALPAILAVWFGPVGLGRSLATLRER